MELKQALENINRYSPKFAEEEILCIKENKDEAIPFLLEFVKKVVDRGTDLFEDEYAYMYAMFLLAEFRVNAAFPYLIQYLEFDMDHTDFLLGDTITEDFGSILASTATKSDLPRIKSVVENTGLDLFHRIAALNTIQVLYVEDVLSRVYYFGYLRHLLENFRNDPSFLAFVIVDCEEAGARELLPLIETLYESDFVDEQVASLQTVKRKLSASDEQALKHALKQNNHSSFIIDTIQRMRSWACFNNEPYTGSKVGRNELCPCGSGKKYKKCCGY